MIRNTLTRQDIKTLALAALGGALEFYDFIIFVFFAAVVGQLFFPPEIPEWFRQLQTFAIFAAGYLARPLGGIILAHFGDLLGRKKMFTLSIFLMAIPTLLMGSLPVYTAIGLWAPIALLLLRIIQGAAIGGEVPGAWVFVAEHVPSRFVGLACGILTAGLTAGILIGSLVATGINMLYTPDEVLQFAWRFPFLLGGAFGIIAVYLRRWLHETPVFEEMQKRKELSKELPLKTVIREHRPAVILSMLLTWVLSASIVVVILMTPTLLQKQYQILPATSLMANSLATICLSIGCIIYGLLCDRIGSGKTLVIGCLALISSVSWFFTQTNLGSEQLFLNYAIAGASVGIVGAVPYVMVNAFPAVVRFSGLSFSYNLSYAIFGGLTPMIVTLLLKYSALAPMYYVVSVAFLGLILGLYLLKCENKTLPLDEGSEIIERA